MAKSIGFRNRFPHFGIFFVLAVALAIPITTYSLNNVSTNLNQYAAGLLDNSATPSATLTITPASIITDTPILTPTSTPTPTLPPTTNVMVLAVGDLASSRNKAEATHDIVMQYPQATIITLGDNVQQTGSSSEFTNYFDPVWGQEKNRIYPAAGNHEYETQEASAYFDYFGAAAGSRTKGYYSFNLGNYWHVVVLNSNCTQISGGCAAGSLQEKWLRKDLSNNSRKCTLAIWHHPLFTSSGINHTETKDLWKALYDYHTEILLNGHEHNYERFAPQTANGIIDENNGLREFVVGTGGFSHISFDPKIEANSRIRNADTYGVLQLILRPSNYSYKFLPVAGKTFTDGGTRDCF